MAPDFINSGSVQVMSGTLQLSGGSTCPWSALAASAGFTVDSGASLVFGNNSTAETYVFNSKGYITGAGAVTFGSGVSASFASGSSYNPTGETLIDTGGGAGSDVVFTSGSTVGPLGNLTIDSGKVNFSSSTTNVATVTLASLNLTAGVLTGPDTVNVSGLLTWSNGSMEGSGTTVAEGGIDLGLTSGSANPELDAHTVINQGTANWDGSGEFDLFDGATFVNQSGATFNQQSNIIATDPGDGEAPSGVFDNQGTFVVAGAATMEASFDSESQVNINSGGWELSGAGARPVTLPWPPALRSN